MADDRIGKHNDRTQSPRGQRDIRPHLPIWLRPALPTSSLRLAAESFIKEWYGEGFLLDTYTYTMGDGARSGTFMVRGGLFTHRIAYSDATQRYEVSYLD